MNSKLDSTANMLKQSLSILKQLGSVGKSQDATDLLHEDLVMVEQRVEPAKKASQVIHKKLQGCLQSQGLDADKRTKKLPLMLLSISMAESLKDFDGDSSIRKVLEMCCFMEQVLATQLADFEMKLEKEVLEPLNKLSEEDLPEILKNKKQFAKLTTDWQNARNKTCSERRWTGPQAKQDGLQEEVDETWRKLENIKDQYSADLYHFATKEDDYANYFIRLLELQAEYHKTSHEFLHKNITELKDNHRNREPPRVSQRKVFGQPLLSHLSESGREIAVPIQECVHMLLRTGMTEEGLFRLTAAASVVKKLKTGLDGGTVDHGEFKTDPHAVAGALKCYLRELPEPLMTFDLYNDWFKAAGEKEMTDKLEQFRVLLKKLPPENYNNLRYLIQFMSLLSKQQAVNRMTSTNIAIVLGPNLLWPLIEGEVGMFDMAAASSVQVMTVIEPLIQYCSSLFPEEEAFELPELPEGPDSTLSVPPVQSPVPEKEKLERSSSSSSTASSCSSYHTALSKTNSTASLDSGGFFLVKSGSVSRAGTTAWESPAHDSTQPNPTARNSSPVPGPAEVSNPPAVPSSAEVVRPPSPAPRATLAPNAVQARSLTQRQSSEPGPLESISEAELESPKASLKITSPYKPRRSFQQGKMPVYPAEQVVVQYSKPRAPVRPTIAQAEEPKTKPQPSAKPQAPAPPTIAQAGEPKTKPEPSAKPQAPAQPTVTPAGEPNTQPQPTPRPHPPALKKPPLKKPGLKAPKCPPPRPPPSEAKHIPFVAQ